MCMYKKTSELLSNCIGLIRHKDIYKHTENDCFINPVTSNTQFKRNKAYLFICFRTMLKIPRK